MATTANFWDKAARKYATRPIQNMTAYEATLDRVRSYLGDQDRALELGCGTGSTALLLSENAAHITATDYSSEMIAIAREKASEQGVDNVDFAVVDAGAAGDVATYDVVMAFNLLHLVPDLKATLAQVRASVEEGGLFISKTPCLGRKKYLFLPLIWVLQKLGRAPFVSFLSVEDLEQAVLAAGFEIVETGDYPKSTPSHFVVARKV